MKNSSNILIGLLAGLAAGAALGLLIAPESGTETRDKLSRSLNDLGESIKDKAAAEIEKLASMKEDLVGKFTGQAEEFQKNQNYTPNA
ncbi:YtxH domain-containing protein [Pedobacter frigoris]|uniref:YtxH domain-containing protein n=1 Tax=Pedobacter frigoris TaxID=2571272 RepID=A0A4U1CJ36_9SPHI|nr:YtxH domain-containing protein [Pedobacter frigoris]TKC06086.1 YtxH domain-containing protein [Pedobacter frigoris]